MKKKKKDNCNNKDMHMNTYVHKYTTLAHTHIHIKLLVKLCQENKKIVLGSHAHSDKFVFICDV